MTAHLRGLLPSTKPLAHELWSLEPVPATAICRPYSCEKVEEVRSYEAATLVLACVGAGHHEGHGEHREGQVAGAEVDDEEGDLAIGVVLAVGICEGKGETCDYCQQG